MSTERFFLDSNILLYLISGDGKKADKADKLLGRKPVISAQVLNEFTAVARRKYKLGWPEIEEVLRLAKACCEVMPLTQATHELAVTMAKDAKLRIYDACIVASAELADCGILYTEDLNDGQSIGGVTVRNPFV